MMHQQVLRWGLQQVGLHAGAEKEMQGGHCCMLLLEQEREMCCGQVKV
jgi:hypothetical protein